MYTSRLFRQEGVNQGIYEPFSIQVTTIQGEVLTCRCYRQTRNEWGDVDRRPSAAYKKLMIRGAGENGVPADYITNYLERIVDNGYDGELNTSADLKTT